LRRGRFDFLGRRLDLTEGRIVAAGTQIPFVSVTAQTIADDLTAKIVLEGPANAPELTLSSVPDRPQDEILAQILFGRNVENLSAFQIARLISSLQTLAGGRPGTLEFARRGLNVDNFDVQTNAAGQTELTIGQNLSENVYSDVEIDSAGNSKLNLNLDLNANTTLRGSVSNDGETGIGVFWERDY
jgi:translocation and assembly module TamB